MVDIEGDTSASANLLGLDRDFFCVLFENSRDFVGRSLGGIFWGIVRAIGLEKVV
jgi:hypothetical protein